MKKWYIVSNCRTAGLEPDFSGMCACGYADCASGNRTCGG